ADYQRLLRELRASGKAEIRGLAYVKQITLGRLTGGLDDDPQCPGDDAIVVLLEPRDLDDQVVKIPGHVRVDVHEIHPQGLKQLLSTWDIPARELRTKWETPLIGSPAYRLVLRWKIFPQYERLRIVVRFTTLDGQVFETDRDVTIRPPRRDPQRCPLPPPPVFPFPHDSPPTHQQKPYPLPTVPFTTESLPTPQSQPTLGLPVRRPVTSPRSEPLLVPPFPLAPSSLPVATTPPSPPLH
ncbi:MAG: hypothetical protein RMJ19_09665, partial [Gemmatales bacterium]|nr:hypothetical protein [Gemmatales bacterium]MDW8175927.1 hypothetical protein [Gemmatales bacterium]